MVTDVFWVWVEDNLYYHVCVEPQEGDQKAYRHTLITQYGLLPLQPCCSLPSLSYHPSCPPSFLLIFPPSSLPPSFLLQSLYHNNKLVHNQLHVLSTKFPRVGERHSLSSRGHRFERPILGITVHQLLSSCLRCSLPMWEWGDYWRPRRCSPPSPCWQHSA